MTKRPRNAEATKQALLDAARECALATGEFPTQADILRKTAERGRPLTTGALSSHQNKYPGESRDAFRAFMRDAGIIPAVIVDGVVYARGMGEMTDPETEIIQPEVNLGGVIEVLQVCVATIQGSIAKLQNGQFKL